MPARQSGSPRQQCIGVISAFVDSIDSQIILRMICESKILIFEGLIKVQMKCFFFIPEFERAAKIRKIAVYRFLITFLVPEL